MRLALVRQRWSALGGAENTLLALTWELLRQGHEVTLVTAELQPPPALSSLANLHWRPAPVWQGKVGRVLGFAVNTRRVLQQGRFDVVFSLERTLHQDAYRAGDGCHREWLARRRPYDSRPERLHLALSPFHLTLLSLEKRLFQDPGLKLVIANSRQVQAEVRRHYQVAPEKIRVIYNGVDRERFSPQRLAALSSGIEELGLEPGLPSILFVGSGFKRKGLHFLITALAGMQRRESRLLVVGHGRTAPYQRLAQQLEVAHRVRFLGPQPRVERFYANARVLALPTIYDPCSNVVLEALACGRPVITTAANGASEFIHSGANGAILARPDDAKGLAAALDEYLERAADPAVQHAAVNAVVDLSWSRTVAETLAALEALAVH
jgi:UDP-glucose:(heptosyl)LPS alpha-1,3-glucosyltransferase